MGVGLLQIAAQGESKRHFVSDDGASPWVTRWHRTTNFAVENIKQEWTLDPDFGKRTSVVVGRLGDLLAGLTLEVTLTKKENTFPKCLASYHPIEALVKEVSLSIGGIEVEKHTSDFFRVFDTFLREPCKSAIYRGMTNFDAPTLNSVSESTETLVLPLMFTFCRHLGNALPLISMMDSEVRVWFEFATAQEVGVHPTGFSATVYADYVLLDSFERSWFMKNPHEYLVEQVQYNQLTLQDGVPSNSSTTTVKVPIKFFRPVKVLYWFLKNTTPSDATRTHHGRYVGDTDNTFLAYQPNPFDMSQFGLVECISERLAPLVSATLFLNGQSVVTERGAHYFQKVQPYTHLPKQAFPGLYSFSFAIRPGDLQPTGVCNFSTLDEASLHLELKRNTAEHIWSSEFAGTKCLATGKNIDELREVHVIAVNYNVFKVEFGRAYLVM